MSKTSRLRLRRERNKAFRTRLVLACKDGYARLTLHVDGWRPFAGGKTVLVFKRREDADTALASEILKDPSLIGRAWITSRLK